MGRWRPILGSLLLGSLVAMGAGCGGRTQVESDLGVKGAPDWVNEGTQALSDRGGRLFHGVGQAAPMGNESLQISTADNRARAEVARVLSSYLDVLQDDYASAARSDGESYSEESVSRQIKSLSQVNLSGARILGHWKDPKTATVYSVAELDLKEIKATSKAVNDMNEGLKGHIDRKAENIFDRFSRGEK